MREMSRYLFSKERNMMEVFVAKRFYEGNVALFVFKRAKYDGGFRCEEMS